MPWPAPRNGWPLSANGSASIRQRAQTDPEFQSLRQDLAAHLKKVAAATSEQFGEPWGLIAMDEASGRRAGASILVTGPKFVTKKQRALPATAS